MSQVHKSTLILPDEASVEPFAVALEGYVLGQAAFEFEGGPRWSLEFYSEGVPNAAVLSPRLALAALEAGISEPEPVCAPLPDIDWVTENQKSFRAIHAGRFVVHQEFHTTPPPPGKIGLIVNAGTAFGTGTHATTLGCLEMLDALMKTGRPRRALDLGCGTAILAMGLARMGVRKVVAADIDPEAVRVARENAAINRVGRHLSIHQADGFHNLHIGAAAPYPLIVANILARPLVRLSAEMVRHLAPCGRLVLSGLLNRQEAMVLAAYRPRGLVLVERRRIDGWSTLLLERRRGLDSLKM